jgi:hypothetical protein
VAPSGAIVDLPQNVIADEPYRLSDLVVLGLRDDVPPTVVKVERYLSAMSTVLGDTEVGSDQVVVSQPSVELFQIFLDPFYVLFL